jgi:hypothetical protein
MPGAVGQGAVEGEADAGGAAMGGELGRDDPRVIGDQQVTRRQQAGKVGDVVVREGGADMQQARGFPWAGRFLRDQPRGKVERILVRGRDRS